MLVADYCSDFGMCPGSGRRLRPKRHVPFYGNPTKAGGLEDKSEIKTTDCCMLAHLIPKSLHGCLRVQWLPQKCAPHASRFSQQVDSPGMLPTDHGCPLGDCRKLKSNMLVAGEVGRGGWLLHDCRRLEAPLFCGLEVMSAGLSKRRRAASIGHMFHPSRNETSRNSPSFSRKQLHRGLGTDSSSVLSSAHPADMLLGPCLTI